MKKGIILILSLLFIFILHLIWINSEKQETNANPLTTDITAKNPEEKELLQAFNFTEEQIYYLPSSQLTKYKSFLPEPIAIDETYYRLNSEEFEAISPAEAFDPKEKSKEIIALKTYIYPHLTDSEKYLFKTDFHWIAYPQKLKIEQLGMLVSPNIFIESQSEYFYYSYEQEDIFTQKTTERIIKEQKQAQHRNSMFHSFDLKIPKSSYNSKFKNVAGYLDFIGNRDSLKSITAQAVTGLNSDGTPNTSYPSTIAKFD